MTPEAFLQGRLTGFGVVRSFTGKVLRRFHMEIVGVWSQEHRALHLDETYAYTNGDAFHRCWALHTDPAGFVIGHDALQAARLRGHQRGEDFRFIFDRPRHPGGPSKPHQIFDFITVSPESAMIVGRITRFGLPLATIHAALIRESQGKELYTRTED